MENINWNELFSNIPLILAILSPIISTFLTHRYQMKMRSADFYDKHRAEAIENYIHSVGMLIQTSHCDGLDEYGKAFSEIYLYVPNSSWNIIEDIDSALEARNFVLAKQNLKLFCEKLYKSPPRFKY